MTETLQQEVAVTEAAATEATTTTENVEVKEVTQEVSTSILDGLSEDLKTHKSLEKFKDKGVEDVVKSYLNLEGLIGKKVEDMPSETVKQFLDVPASPDKYAIADDAKDIITEEILAIAGENNISQTQMKALTDKMVEIHRAEGEAAKAEALEIAAKNEKALRDEFGTAFDDRLKQIENTIVKYGGQEVLTKAKESGILHSTEFMKFMDNVTQNVLSATMVGTDYKQSLVLTPEEAKSQIELKKADKDFMQSYLNPKDSGHSVAVKEWEKLFKAAYSE